MRRCQLKLHHRNQSTLYLIFSKKRSKSSGKQLNNKNAILKKKKFRSPKHLCHINTLMCMKYMYKDVDANTVSKLLKQRSH